MGAILAGIPFLQNFNLFLLFFLRATALIFSSPIFGRGGIPAVMRVGLALFIAIAFFSASAAPPLPETSLLEYVLLCVRELLFGVCMGFATNLYFSSVLFSGSIIDMQIGFSMAQVLDPQTHTQVPLIGNFLNIVLILCFFWVGGHLRLIGLLYESYARVPIGQVSVSFQQLSAAAIHTFATAFLLGFQVAMPVVAASLLLEVALGVMNRTVPQLNMYVLGLPIKVGVGIVLLALIIPSYVRFTGGIFNHLYDGIGLFMEGLVPHL